MGERKFGSQSYLSTSDKRNHLAIYIGLGTRRTRLWWQTSGETPAWSWDSLVEAFLNSSKIILLSQPGKHLELIINLKTAKELSLTIPPEVLLQATKVIK